MKKYILPALMLALIPTLDTLWEAQHIDNFYKANTRGFIEFLLLLIIFLGAVRWLIKRKSPEGVNFKEGFIIAIQLTIIATLFAAIIHFIYCTYINTEYLHSLNQVFIKGMELEAKESGKEISHTLENQLKNALTPLTSSFNIIFSGIALGAIASLIAGLLFRTKSISELTESNLNS